MKTKKNAQWRCDYGHLHGGAEEPSCPTYLDEVLAPGSTIEETIKRIRARAKARAADIEASAEAGIAALLRKQPRGVLIYLERRIGCEGPLRDEILRRLAEGDG